MRVSEIWEKILLKEKQLLSIKPFKQTEDKNSKFD